SPSSPSPLSRPTPALALARYLRRCPLSCLYLIPMTPCTPSPSFPSYPATPSTPVTTIRHAIIAVTEAELFPVETIHNLQIHTKDYRTNGKIYLDDGERFTNSMAIWTMPLHQHGIQTCFNLLVSSYSIISCANRVKTIHTDLSPIRVDFLYGKVLSKISHYFVTLMTLEMMQEVHRNAQA
ncbi:hypothetical protein ACJX0J_018357, partial [Zea mays]